MKVFGSALWLLLTATATTAATTTRKSARARMIPQQSLNDALLEKATLLTDNLLTPSTPLSPRNLEGDDNNDDYYNYDYVSMSGFSLKFAKCQTIQRFSEDAIKNGEYSAMVKDDIIILRLCPTSQCSSNKQYGCRYNFAEYAIDIVDYVKIMLKYTMDRRDKMCDFCAACNNSNNDDDAAAAAQGDDNARRLIRTTTGTTTARQNRRNRSRRVEGDEEGDEQQNQDEEENNNQDDHNDEQQDNGGDEEDDHEDNNDSNDQEEEDNNDQEGDKQFDDDEYYKADDNYNYNNADADGAAAAAGDDDAVNQCTSYYDECQGIASYCNGGAADDDGNGGMDYDEYNDYLDCVKVNGVNNYQDSQYWIRPRCSSSTEIHMGVFFDPYCSQYAGNDVNLREFSGLHFSSSVLAKYSAGTCINCSEDDDYPYQDANSVMCNKLNAKGARCTQNMITQLFDEDDDQEHALECSFIESVRYGTYNEKGEIYIDKSIYGEKSFSEVTGAQTAGLVISILLCVGLGLYSCYLHHSITNLLIKSLSHSHLLPPSRHRSRKAAAAARSVTSKRSSVAPNNGDKDDWDHSVGQLT